ncbi:hypothetical protein F-VV57_0483 [Faustovirus]|nr:hypothetical protein F-VV57_0483 [Faustovirus]QJX73751.1 hypothetical protein F-VV63_0485 [Faustovirus]
MLARAIKQALGGAFKVDMHATALPHKHVGGAINRQMIRKQREYYMRLFNIGAIAVANATCNGDINNELNGSSSLGDSQGRLNIHEEFMLRERVAANNYMIDYKLPRTVSRLDVCKFATTSWNALHMHNLSRVRIDKHKLVFTGNVMANIEKLFGTTYQTYIDAPCVYIMNSSTMSIRMLTLERDVNITNNETFDDITCVKMIDEFLMCRWTLGITGIDVYDPSENIIHNIDIGGLRAYNIPSKPDIRT